MNTTRSQQLFDKSKRNIPGGVNSPVRSFSHVGGTPIFMQSAVGAYLTDVDGNRYIDYVNSWGPMILGHGHPSVIATMQRQMSSGISFGTPTEQENTLAELAKKMVPRLDKLRLTSSGTEACMTAVRLARGYTGRTKIIKFEGCYHGHADVFLVKAGSGVATLGIERMPGITAGVAADTLIAPYNDLEATRAMALRHLNEVAAIIVEPVAGNMGCVPPMVGFLEGLRTLCDEQGIVLILDEVMTGFRLAKGGAQERLKIDADIVTYGKVIGGGMPLAAIGGKKDIMDFLAPVGKVYQAGTLSGNPLAVACGYATLSELYNHPEIYAALDKKGTLLKSELSNVFRQKDVRHVINQLGSMISLHFDTDSVSNFKTAAASDIPMFNRFFHHMLAEGIYLPPSAYESWFLCESLSDEDIEKTVQAAQKFAV